MLPGGLNSGSRKRVADLACLKWPNLARRTSNGGMSASASPNSLAAYNHPAFVEKEKGKRKEKKSGYLGVELGQEEGVDEGQVGSAAGVGDGLGAHALDLCPRFACNSGSGSGKSGE